MDLRLAMLKPRGAQGANLRVGADGAAYGREALPEALPEGRAVPRAVDEALQPPGVQRVSVSACCLFLVCFILNM